MKPSFAALTFNQTLNGLFLFFSPPPAYRIWRGYFLSRLGACVPFLPPSSWPLLDLFSSLSLVRSSITIKDVGRNSFPTRQEKGFMVRKKKSSSAQTWSLKHEKCSDRERGRKSNKKTWETFSYMDGEERVWLGITNILSAYFFSLSFLFPLLAFWHRYGQTTCAHRLGWSMHEMWAYSSERKGD